MPYANGRFPPSALTEVQSDIYLSITTARAWKRAVAAAPNAIGRRLSIARPAGGYRSYFVQADMRIHPERYNLNPGSGARLALPGYSKHGLGICVDVVGSQMDSILINFLRKYGFTRPLYNDPNHFIHDGVTAISAPPSTVTKPTPTPPSGRPSVAKPLAVKVKPGDTWASLAKAAGVTYARLLVLNPQVRDPNRLFVGQTIRTR